MPQADLVDGIAYSSGLGGRTESCLSVLDLEQQGLSDDALKVVLDLIFRPAQPREVEKKNFKYVYMTLPLEVVFLAFREVE